MRKRPVVDHFGNLIEVGDRYFYGAPPTTGVVSMVKVSTIELECGMKCKSPDKGICLDKIPGGPGTEYRVGWSVWTGVEPCGRSEYSRHSQSFHDLEKAMECFETKSLHNDQVTLKKITTKLLEESE